MKPERFNVIMSVMTAVVTVVGAAVACLASGASNAAGNNDFEGLTAAISAQETTIVNNINAYEHYHAYTIYRRYNELGNLLYDEANAATDQAAFDSLDRQKQEAWGLAQGIQALFFPGRYLDPDGAYNLQRELDEEFAEAAQQKDIVPGPHFEVADTLRLRANLLTGVLIFLAIAFWFFTVAQATKNRLKYLFGLGGFLFVGISILSVLIVQVML
jgi:hypothetical protein